MQSLGENEELVRELEVAENELLVAETMMHQSSDSTDSYVIPGFGRSTATNANLDSSSDNEDKKVAAKPRPFSNERRSDACTTPANKKVLAPAYSSPKHSALLSSAKMVSSPPKESNSDYVEVQKTPSPVKIPFFKKPPPTTTQAGHNKRTMVFVKVEMLLGPCLSITVVPISGIQMDMVESTAQVENIVVGVMRDGNIKSIVKVVDKPFTLHYLGKNLYDQYNLGVIERLEAFHDYLSVFTSDGKAYVIKHKGNGNFTRPHQVHFGHDAGAIEYTKLARNQEGNTMVVASCQNEGVSARAVSWMKNPRRIQLEVEEVAVPLRDVIEYATNTWMEDGGQDMDVQLTKRGDDVYFLNLAGRLCHIHVGGPTNVSSSSDDEEEDKEDKDGGISFHKFALGQVNMEKTVFPFIVGCTAELETVWVFSPGFEACKEESGQAKKFHLPGKAVSIGASDSGFAHVLFDMADQVEQLDL